MYKYGYVLVVQAHYCKSFKFKLFMLFSSLTISIFSSFFFHFKGNTIHVSRDILWSGKYVAPMCTHLIHKCNVHPHTNSFGYARWCALTVTDISLSVHSHFKRPKEMKVCEINEHDIFYIAILYLFWRLMKYDQNT